MSARFQLWQSVSGSAACCLISKVAAVYTQPPLMNAQPLEFPLWYRACNYTTRAKSEPAVGGIAAEQTPSNFFSFLLPLRFSGARLKTFFNIQWAEMIAQSEEINKVSVVRKERSFLLAKGKNKKTCHSRLNLNSFSLAGAPYQVCFLLLLLVDPLF